MLKEVIENLYEMVSMEVEECLIKWNESIDRMLDSSEIEDYAGYKIHSDQCQYWEKRYLEAVKERTKYSKILARLG